MSAVIRPAPTLGATAALAAAALIALSAAAAPALAEELQSRPAETQLASPRFDGWQGPRPNKPDCQCRHSEGRAFQGQTVCIRQGSRQVLARCEMALNNPFWRVLQQSCTPTS